MALKNLFDMVKADRYTQDGREAIIKALEAETEDKVYQIGEISQKTGLQKTANGWVKPKNGKQPGAKKEEYKPSRRVDPKKQPQVSNPNVLGMTASGAKKRFEALGGQFVENKNGVDVFKTRDGDLVEVHYDDNKKVLRTQTTPAEETESQPVLSQTDGKGNKVEIKITPTKGGGFYVDKYVNGKKIGLEHGNTRESAEAKAKSMMEQHMADPDYRAENKPAAEKTDGFDYRSSMEKDPRSAASFKGAVSHSIPMNQTDRDELEGLSKFMSEEKATYQNALKNRAQALVDGHKGNGDWFPEKEKAIMKIAKAVGFDKELHKFIEEENRGYDLGYSEDAAPRVLTGDTRIRVRKA
jgi:hypothetical protein